MIVSRNKEPHIAQKYSNKKSSKKSLKINALKTKGKWNE